MAKIKKSKKKQSNMLFEEHEDFVDLLRRVFIRKPKSPRGGAEFHIWNRIEKAQRKNHPIAYFLLHDVVLYISVKKRRFEDFVWWFRYRLQKEHRYHLVDTKLNPGYHSNADILLHSSMSVLVDYVETHRHGSDEDGPVGLRSYISFLEKNLDPKTWPEWERSYGKKYQKEKIAGDLKYVLAYKEVLGLYNWWKFQREVEHLSLEQEKNEFYDNRKFTGADFDFESTKAPVDYSKLKGKEKKLYIAERNKLTDFINREEALNDKDDEMLARLAKVRKHLW
jgi:hypothetical protein